jgi:hypothetical protein
VRGMLVSENVGGISDMSRKYSILTTYEPPDEDAPEIEVRIWFTFIPGCPEQGPSYASGGEPATAPEVEFDSVERLDGAKWTNAFEIMEWASEYLRTKCYDRAVEEASDDGPDPDYEYERDRDDKMMGVGRYQPMDAGDDW